MTRLVLASASPRRRAILAALGAEVDVLPADVDETVLPGEDAHDAAERLARAKAQAVLPAVPRGATVLSADTIVVLELDGTAFTASGP